MKVLLDQKSWCFMSLENPMQFSQSGFDHRLPATLSIEQLTHPIQDQ